MNAPAFTFGSPCKQSAAIKCPPWGLTQLTVNPPASIDTNLASPVNAGALPTIPVRFARQRLVLSPRCVTSPVVVPPIVWVSLLHSPPDAVMTPKANPTSAPATMACVCLPQMCMTQSGMNPTPTTD